MSATRGFRPGLALHRDHGLVFTDDIDGGKAREMVAFGLDGVIYEIDLHNKKAAALTEVASGSRGKGATNQE